MYCRYKSNLFFSCLSFLVGCSFFLLMVSGTAMCSDSCDKAWQLMDRGIAAWGNGDEQLMLFDEAYSLCPELVEAKLRAGKIYSQRGELEQASRTFQEVITRVMSDDYFMTRPGSKDTLLEAMLSLADVYRKEGRLEDAEDEYSRILVMFPHNPAAQNQLQYVQKRLHRYANALPPRYNILTNPPFTRISGFSIPMGRFLIDAQYRFWKQKAPLDADMIDDPDALFPPEERTVNVDLWTAGVRYGITDNFSIGVIGKYFIRKVKIDSRTFRPPFPYAPEIKMDEYNFKVSGLGDTVIMMKYQLLGKRKTRLSIFNLLSIPTGNDKASDTDNNMTRTIPLGSGSFDNTPGLAFTTAFDSFIANFNLSYRFTNGKNVGDEFNVGTALSYSYKHTVFASLELAYRWRGKVKIKQRAEDFWVTEKKTSMFFIEPGLQFMVYKGLKIEAGVKIPVNKPDNGWVEDYVFTAGISKAFF